MIPPERGFKREAGAQSAEPLSTIQKVVRYAERDDLLLYITAAFGILMPAVMYFLYKTMHVKYYEYQKRKEKHEKQKEKRKLESKRLKRTVTIFYCADQVKRVAYDLAEQVEQFDPIVAKLTPSDLTKSKQTKAFLIFITDTGDDEKLSPQLSEFLDWLDFKRRITEIHQFWDEVRYEHRQKSFMRGTNFIVLGLGKSLEAGDEQQTSTEGSVGSDSNQAAITLHKRLQSLHGIPLAEPRHAELDSREFKAKIDEFAKELRCVLRQFQYGAFDGEQERPELVDHSSASGSEGSVTDTGESE